jgi:16S rRNA (guanine966-N2)-methyltransferase
MGELRLSGGEFRGRKLRVAHGVRPTEGRVREALFSIWQTELPGARVLDLFAGSGAFALEALGRGAAAAVLVEGDPQVARALRENVATLQVKDAVHLYRMRLPAALGMLAQREGAFDLAFVDPPYGFEDAARLLRELAPLMTEGGSIAFEHGAQDEPAAAPAGWELTQTRCYGGSCLSFYARST